MPDITEKEPQLMVFRPTDALRRRLEASKPIIAEKLDQAGTISNQLAIPWLLNYAMDQLGVSRNGTGE